ncbi:MAG: 4Fe-4S dicluster domain-containing protein [Candidatus Bathyarchaeia archaeon]|nr:4Fe-4S dicluster domain-containing protein [Candidatus Bathyarchaeota archaeon]
MRRILVFEEYCIGCGLCEVYCRVQHSQSKDLIKAYNREQPKPLSRVKLVKAKPVSFAVQCRHCKDPPCVTACLSGAMRRDNDSGLVVHDPDKCIGCWTCIMVCPYTAISINVLGSGVVAKCDLCSTLDTPACVANCPNEALVCEEVL